MKLVTVKESHNQYDLVVLKSRLESEGIYCRFKNEQTVRIVGKKWHFRRKFIEFLSCNFFLPNFNPIFAINTNHSFWKKIFEK